MEETLETERALGPLELELQAVMSLHVGISNPILVLWKNSMEF